MQNQMHIRIFRIDPHRFITFVQTAGIEKRLADTGLPDIVLDTVNDTNVLGVLYANHVIPTKTGVRHGDYFSWGIPPRWGAFQQFILRQPYPYDLYTIVLDGRERLVQYLNCGVFPSAGSR